MARRANSDAVIPSLRAARFIAAWSSSDSRTPIGGECRPGRLSEGLPPRAAARASSMISRRASSVSTRPHGVERYLTEYYADQPMQLDTVAQAGGTRAPVTGARTGP
jgi:hypothetical protein